MRNRLLRALFAASCAGSLLGLNGCGGAGGTTATTPSQPDVFAAANAVLPAAHLASFSSPASGGEDEAVPGEFIVKYKDSRGAMQTEALRTLGVTPIKQLPGLKAAIVRMAQGTDPAGVQSQLAGNSNIEYIEPNYVRHISLAPNDPNFKSQYGLRQISAPAAWDITQGSDRVTIAVIDSGVDMRHPDLAPKIVKGHNMIADSDNAMDDNGHGTHTAGIAAAITNNGVGVAGVAGKARIMPIKVMDANGRGDDSSIAEGIVWATDHDADVISMSLGGPQAGKTLGLAVNYALAHNVIVVAAMGNNGNNIKNFPAGYPGVIAVGATDAQDRWAPFSNYGSWISVSAPGVDILSTTPTYRVSLNSPVRNAAGQVVFPGMKQNYDILDGTSMAAPYVSGVCALIRSKFPSLSPAQVKQRLESTADPSAAGIDPYYGHGRVNAAKALS